MRWPAITRERLAAVGALVLVLSGCVLTVGYSLAARSEAIEELGERREVLARLVRGAPSAGAAGQARIARAPPTAFIEAPTQGQAGAQLQSYFSRLALAQQATIASSGVEAPTQEAPDAIRVQANLEIAPDALQALVYRLETGTPYLTVDTLAVQPSSAASRSDTAEAPLRVNLMLRGLWRRELPASPSAPGTAEPSDEPANPLAAQPLEDLSATRDQPLFAPTRRPPAPPPAPPEPAPLAEAPVRTPLPPEPPAVIFYGVVMEEGNARAILRGPGNESVRVRIGDKVGEWTVTQLDRRQMVLSLDDRSKVFTLFSKGKQSGSGLPTHLEEAAPSIPQGPRPQAGGPQASSGARAPRRAPIHDPDL
jgi:general secretion pathway protein M